MSLRFYHRGVRTMIIPSNAGHGQSRVVIGVDEFALNIINSYFQSASMDLVAVGGIFQYIGGGSDWFIFEVSCEDATDPQGTIGAVYRGVYVFGQVFLQMQYIDNEMHFYGPAEWLLANGEQIHFNGDNDPNTGIRIHNMRFELSSTGRFVYDNETLGVANIWNPSWTQSTSNPTLGDGTLLGRYMRFGEWCLLWMRLTIGSTTSLGTGSFGFSLPFAPALDHQPIPGFYWDSSAGIAVPVVARAMAGSNDRIVEVHTPDGQAVTQTNPFTPAQNDRLTLIGWYFCERP